jgi:flagellar M-ring protein FliF
VEFTPPIPGEMDGIVRSASQIWETQRRAAGAEGIPGTDTNAMGTVEYPYGTLGDGELYARYLYERNYEMNELRTMIERAQGTIQYLSISVLINSENVEEDYSEAIRNLIAMGIGVAPMNIAVEHVPFYEDTSLADWWAAWDEYEEQLRRQALFQNILMWAVILLLGLAFISLIKTFIKAVKPPPEPEPALADGGMIDYLADDEEYMIDEMEHYEDIELNTKSTGLEQIERFIDKDPSAVAQLLRNWLVDE